MKKSKASKVPSAEGSTKSEPAPFFARFAEKLPKIKTGIKAGPKPITRGGVGDPT